MVDAPGGNRPRRFRWLRIAVIGVVAITLMFLGRRLGLLLPEAAAVVADMGVWGPLAFVVLYIAGDLLLVPGSLLTLAAGALFGLWRGTVVAFVASSLGAVVTFLVARYLARGVVQRRLSGNARLRALDAALRGQGLKLTVLLRLSPIFPYSILNYALGLTGIRTRDFLLGSIGMLPGTVLYVYFGHLAGNVAAIASGAVAPRGPTYWLAVGLGLTATLAATLLVARSARRELLRVSGTGETTKPGSCGPSG